jgi:hypothetical protein
MCYMVLVETLMDFLRDVISLFLSTVGLFVTKRAYLHLEKPTLQDVFI